jgi:hypothetical protein
VVEGTPHLARHILAPTEEATLTEEATPTEEATLTEEAMPTEEAIPTEEATPTEEAILTEEANQRGKELATLPEIAAAIEAAATPAVIVRPPQPVAKGVAAPVVLIVAGVAFTQAQPDALVLAAIIMVAVPGVTRSGAPTGPATGVPTGLR